MKGFINPQWAEALGLTLFDSLWQGAIVLIISFVVLLLMKKASPAKRYTIVLAAILILPLLSVTTFLGHLDNGAATSTLNSALNFENTSVFSLELNEASTPIEQAVVSPTVLAKWKVWTSQNANLALVVWLMGAFLFTVRMLGGFYFLNRLKSGASLITDAVWLEKMSTLCESLKIKGKVLLKQSERVSSPLVMGVIKPVIIFPMGLIQALPTDEIEAILVHELAHIKRKDFLINIVINLLQVVYFFHPAFWWLKVQLDAEREFHCDDIALNQLGKKLTLIKALTNASEYKGHKFQPALAFAGKKNQLLSRVKRIVDHKPQMNWLSGFMSLGILVLSFVLMSQNASQEDKPTMADLEEDNIENLMQNQALQDTTKVKKAILELLTRDSKVTVKTDASGTVTKILNDKTEITGEEFETYKAAYEQIHKFSKENQKSQEELSQELVEMTNAENRKIIDTLRKNQLEDEATKLIIEIEKLKNSTQTETEAERSAKTQADQEILRAQKALREVEEENRKIDEALRKNQLGDEVTKLIIEIEKLKNSAHTETEAGLSAKAQADQAVLRAQKVLREVLEVIKASAQSNTSVVEKAEVSQQEIIEWVKKVKEEEKKLVESQEEVRKIQGRTGKILVTERSNSDTRYDFMGSILREEELKKHIYKGLTVTEVIDKYPVYDEKEQREIKVKLVRLEERQANEKQNRDTIEVRFRQAKSTVIKSTGGANNDDNIYYMIDGDFKKGLNLNSIEASQIEDISVIRGQAEVLKRYPDIPTPVSGLIIITTKRNLLRFTIPDSQDSASVYYAFDGKIIDRFEASKLLDANQALSITVMKNKSEILSMFPEIQSPNPKLIKLDSAKDYEKSSTEYLKRFPYYTSSPDLGIVNFDQNFNNSIRTSFTIAAIKEDNAILEIDGELKPDMTVDQIKALDLMNVKSIQIIKNDKMFEYHKKRKLKGYDALIRIVTK